MHGCGFVADVDEVEPRRGRRVEDRHHVVAREREDALHARAHERSRDDVRASIHAASLSRLSPGRTRVNSTGTNSSAKPSPPLPDPRERRGRGIGAAREVLAVVRPARILAGERGVRDRLAHGDQAVEVEPVVPGEVERARRVREPGARETRVQLVERAERAAQPGAVAQDADVVPHQVVERLADRVEVARRPAERREGRAARAFDRFRIGLGEAARRGEPGRHRLAGDAAEHGGVRDAVAAEAVRAVHAAGVLARREEARERGGAVDAELHAAHHVVRGRHHLDSPAGEIEAAVGAALDHALELAPHVLGAEMAHRDVETAMRRGVALAHLGEHRPRHDVARRPLAARVVAAHEPLARAVEEIAARATQALLDDRAGHARVRSGEEAGRMELHHLHVAQAAARRAAPSRGRRTPCRRRACGTCTSSGRRRSRARPRGRAQARTRRCACPAAARRRSDRRRACARARSRGAPPAGGCRGPRPARRGG